MCKCRCLIRFAEPGPCVPSRCGDRQNSAALAHFCQAVQVRAMIMSRCAPACGPFGRSLARSLGCCEGNRERAACGRAEGSTGPDGVGGDPRWLGSRTAVSYRPRSCHGFRVDQGERTRAPPASPDQS